VVGALVTAGVTCLELTLTTPHALECLAAITQDYGAAAAIGAGTVRTRQDATAALTAGAAP
jgi:2-dehydro-3-deoxyphosphogluconate aldolase/(4S)-4-hydroxy-2-oxoglutarate aldolase